MYILFSFIFSPLNKIGGRFLVSMGRYNTGLIKTRLFYESVWLKIVTFFEG
jgi:hypothetical protein